MNRRTLLLGIPAAALAAPAVARRRRPDLARTRRIVTLGDSITQGGGRPGGYVWQMDQYLQVLYPARKIEIVNAGISGHKSTDMRARFQKDVLDRQPDIVTISVGINDIWHGFMGPGHPAGYGPRRVPLDDYRTHVAAMVDAAHAAGVGVVLFTTTIFEDRPDSTRNRRAENYNDAVRALAAERGTALADQFAAFMAAWERNRQVGNGVKLTTDQVHLALPGDTLMAHTALRALGVSEAALRVARPQVESRLPAR